MIAPLTVEIAPRVRTALAQIGRTEDVRFAPDDRRLAVVGFHRDRVLLIDIDLQSRAAGADNTDIQIALTDVQEVRDGLDEPHGVDFLDVDTLVVANRVGSLTVHRLGPRNATSASAKTAVVAQRIQGCVVEPGSVRVGCSPDGEQHVLVCDNTRSVIARFGVGRDADGPTIDGDDVLLRRWLDVPDGVATSDDGRWLAVSNHHAQVVLLYEYGRGFDEHREPDAVLRGASFPHGLRFSPDGNWLLVADGGSPNLHVYERSGDEWRGIAYPTASYRIKGDDAFRAARINPMEGGPKGVDVDHASRVVVVSSDHQALAFFSFHDLVASPGEADDARRLEYEYAALEHQTTRSENIAAMTERATHAERSWRTEYDRATAADERANAAERRAGAAEHQNAAVEERSRQELAAVVESYEQMRLLRFTRPLRHVYYALRSLLGH